MVEIFQLLCFHFAHLIVIIYCWLLSAANGNYADSTLVSHELDEVYVASSPTKVQILKLSFQA